MAEAPATTRRPRRPAKLGEGPSTGITAYDQPLGQDDEQEDDDPEQRCEAP